jgi:hypothetical protein
MDSLHRTSLKSGGIGYKLKKSIATAGLVLGLVSVFVTSSSYAGTVLVSEQQDIIRPGFKLQDAPPPHIILFRPDITISEQSAGGVEQPNVDWTNNARASMNLSLQNFFQQRGAKLSIMPELKGEEVTVMSDYRSLFLTLLNISINHQMTPDDRLPNKEHALDWTLGPGAAKLATLGGLQGADYGLFFLTNDSFLSRSAERAALLSGIFGQEETSSTHIGYAALVDLKTGDLLWLNTDVAMEGDIRTEKGAVLRVSELMQGLYPPPPAPVKKRK